MVVEAAVQATCRPKQPAVHSVCKTRPIAELTQTMFPVSRHCSAQVSASIMFGFPRAAALAWSEHIHFKTIERESDKNDKLIVHTLVSPHVAWQLLRDWNLLSLPPHPPKVSLTHFPSAASNAKTGTDAKQCPLSKERLQASGTWDSW